MDIALALIGKNEVHNIPRLLDSLKGLVKQIVYVDTGSTDKSIDVFIECCNKYDVKYHVEQITWNNDFSYARNVSFSIAEKLDYDWLLWLDCDDVFSDIHQLINNLSNTPQNVNCVLLPYYYHFDASDNCVLTLYRERLFRKTVSPLWEGKIHEYINIGNMNHIILNIPVFHRRSSDDLKKDLKRNLEILKANYNEHNSRDVFYLAKEYFDNNEFDKAKKLFLKRINMSGFKDEIYSSYIKLAEIEYNNKMYAISSKYALEALSIYDDIPDAYYLLGLWAEAIGKLRSAVHFFEACIHINADKYRGVHVEGGQYIYILGGRLKNIGYNTEYKLGIYKPRLYIEPLLKLEKIYYNLGLYTECYDTILSIKNYYKDLNVIRYDYDILRNLLDMNITARAEDLVLNIGSGTQKITGAINIDKYDQHADVINDFSDIDIPPFSCKEITSYHHLEHLDLLEAEKNIKKIINSIKPQGMLIIETPHFALCCEKYLEANKNRNWLEEWFKKTIYGRQITDEKIDDGQFHKWGYTTDDLIDLFQEFSIVSQKVYDNNDTPSVKIKMIKKIVCYFESFDDIVNPSSRLRSFLPAKILVQKGAKGSNILTRRFAGLQELETLCDKAIPNVIVIRTHSAEIKAFISKFRKLSPTTIFIYDYCEDVGAFTAVYDTISSCDLVVCCSKMLAEKVKKDTGKDTIVIPEMYENGTTNEILEKVDKV